MTALRTMPWFSSERVDSRRQRLGPHVATLRIAIASDDEWLERVLVHGIPRAVVSERRAMDAVAEVSTRGAYFVPASAAVKQVGETLRARPRNNMRLPSKAQ